ncbi:MAG: DnaB-like helicase N-terminal domain-containing protein, partial [Deefgea sp.]
MTDYPDQVNEMQASYQVNSRQDETAVYRIPPHSVEAEQSVLGGLMLDNQAFDKIADVIGDGDFYREDHRRIYQAIIKLVEHNRPADVITVKEALDTTNDLTYVGGLAYLGSLVQNTPSAANIRRYAEIVREKSVMRQLASVATEIADATFFPDGRDAKQLLDEAESRVF